MTVRIAINGFGRIGRSVFRIAFGRAGFKVVGINELADSRSVAHLLKYDSSLGRYGRTVENNGRSLTVDGEVIPLSREEDPSRLDWEALGADIVIECTGRLTARTDAGRHIERGAKRVLISAPSPDPDFTMVLGVNGGSYDPGAHRIVSNASCTTNCLAPVLKTLDEAFGVSKARVTTVHSYTNEQSLLDHPAADLQKARAAALSIIPNRTSAAESLIKVLPNFSGRISAASVRVPTPSVSLADITFFTHKSISAEAVNRALEKASLGPLTGITGYSTEPLVSADYIGCPLSGTVDGNQTQSVGGNMGRVLVWYDNEWGYSNRLVEAAEMMCSVPGVSTPQVKKPISRTGR